MSEKNSIKNQQSQQTQRAVKAKALVNLKYNGKVVKIGQSFSVNVGDIKDLRDRKLIYVRLQDIPKEGE